MTAPHLRQLLNIFPTRPSFAFAYGSRIKQQANKAASVGDMVDLILAVDDPLEFHRGNLEKNWSHYSFVRGMGPKLITSIQENFGARIYYNTLIPVGNGNFIKYGVMKTQHLINDLLDWDTLYVSGRLHKPVEIIQEANTEPLTKALRINLQNAVHAALLILEETFTEEQLFMTIAALSYSGDFRMIVGEDKNKVENIVKPQVEKFKQLYQPYVTSDAMQGLLHWNSLSKTLSQDTSSRVVFHHLNLLPKNAQQRLYLSWCKNGPSRDLDDVLLAVSQNYNVSNYVRKAIEEIVWSSSWSQSLKGVITAGFSKSMKYSSKKLRKMYDSLSRK